MSYFPDDLIYHIHIFKEIKDSREYLFNACKIMRDTTAQYREQNTELENLTYDLAWEENEIRRDILTAEIRDVMLFLGEIMALCEINIKIARTAFDTYLANKALVE
jgi:hypothetical protein